MKYKIREKRKAKGLTQKQLGDRLGVSASAVSQFEAGENIKTETLEKIAAALGCSVLDLIPHEEKNGVLSFESGEAFDAARDSIVRAGKKKDDEYIEQLRTPALKLNDIGRKVLLDNAETLAANSYMTRTFTDNDVDPDVIVLEHDEDKTMMLKRK